MNGNIAHKSVMAYCDETGIADPVGRWRMMRVMNAMNEVDSADGPATQDGPDRD